MGDFLLILASAFVAAGLSLWKPATNPAFRAVNMFFAWIALAISLLTEFALNIIGAWRPGATLFLTVLIINLWCASSPASQTQLRWRVGAIALIVAVLVWMLWHG